VVWIAREERLHAVDTVQGIGKLEIAKARGRAAVRGKVGNPVGPVLHTWVGSGFDRQAGPIASIAGAVDRLSMVASAVGEGPAS
jgi:hypothetical protein